MEHALPLTAVGYRPSGHLTTSFFRISADIASITLFESKIRIIKSGYVKA